MATSNSGLHQEARSRDGGLSWAGTGRLSRGSSKTNIRTAVDEPDIILRSPSTTDLERSNSSAREEERRKVLGNIHNLKYIFANSEMHQYFLFRN